jgi:hypothetical protein
MLPEGAISIAAGGNAPVIPDSFFLAGRTAFAIEAETGASSRRKVHEKVERYAAIARSAISLHASLPPDAVDRLLVIFHCATTAHARLVAECIAEQHSTGSTVFLISTADAFHLDYSNEHFRRNLFVDDGKGSSRLYEALASLVTRALFAQIEGRAHGRPLLGYVPLTNVCSAPPGERGAQRSLA